MKNALVSLFILVIIVSCNNSSKQTQTAIKDSVPSCLRQAINAIEKKTTDNPPVQIDEYLYNGKRVFLYTADCCDQFNMLYDENCRSICAPSGGLTGGGDHKCEDFASASKHIKMIWKNKDK